MEETASYADKQGTPQHLAILFNLSSTGFI
jgi:hypothetical protein